MLPIYIFLLSFITLLFMFLHRSINLINPAFGFLIFNWVLGVGVFLLLDFDNPIDMIHVYLTLLTIIMFSLGSLFATKVLKTQRYYNVFWKMQFDERRKDKKIAVFFFIFSSVLSVIYYKMVGYNLFVATITSTAVDDFTTMRLGAYAGENYFAPGYFNQFKNTLLPVTFIFLSFILPKSTFRKLFVGIGGFFVLYCLLGTGQRTFLVTFFLLFVYIFISLKKGDINYLYILLPISILLLLFGLTSVQLGRTDEFSLTDTVYGLIYRIFASNQLSSVVGFQYIYEYKDIALGADWLQSLKGIIPGQTGSRISNEIHYVLFRSDRGTAPLSIWGSYYYNFGFIGSCIGAFLMGIVYQLIYYKFLKGSANKFRICLYASLFLYLSIWVAGSPTQLLNNGILAIVFLLILRKLKWKKTAYETDFTRHG